MNYLFYIFTCFSALLICSCNNNETSEHSNTHELLIGDYQTTQLEFKQLVGGIRDANSYDVASPKLDDVVRVFKRIALDLSKLDPPSEELKISIRKKIQEGDKASEPTGEDMMSLISIEGREKEAESWINDFVSSGKEVGTQLTRLYHKTKKANRVGSGF